MQREDQFSEDVIKIFHNSKGALKNKILEWTNDYEALQLRNHANNRLEINERHFPFNHAAGDYEPIYRDEIRLQQEKRKQTTPLVEFQSPKKEKKSELYHHLNQPEERDSNDY